MAFIDIKALLSEYEVSVRETGKNIGRGWIGIEVCPFCGDSSFHLRINLTSLAFHCWACQSKGPLYWRDKETRQWKGLLPEMEQFKGENIFSIVKPYLTNESTYNQIELQNVPKTRSSVKWPQGILDELPFPHADYLSSRNFNLEMISRTYKIKAVYNTGMPEKYRWRIIVPIHINNRPVSFVAMAITRQNGIVPYLNASPEESVMQVNHCLYNYDSINYGREVVIVEGITDVWRMGKGFVASFTKAMTTEQILLLQKKNPSRVMIMYDADAQKNAISLANKLCGIFPSIEILALPDGDPGDLSEDDATDIRKEIFA